MFGKNPFRTLLYIVVSMVLVKLCDNLGYRIANRKLGSAQKAPRGQAYTLPGLSPDDAEPADTAGSADSAEVAPTTTPGK